MALTFPCDVDRSWFNANRPFLEYADPDRKWILIFSSQPMEGRHAGLCGTLQIRRHGSKEIHLLVSDYMDTFESVDPSELDFPVACDRKRRLELNRHRVAEW